MYQGAAIPITVPGGTYAGARHRRTRRGVGKGARPPSLKIFRANSVFRASVSCSKILNDKKYIFNTVKNSRATLFFKASASCSKILNDKRYIFNTVKNSRATLFFKASASCSKILNDKKYIFNTVKNSSANSVFQGKRKLLKNSEC